MPDELDAILRLEFEDAVSSAQAALDDAFAQAADTFGELTGDALTSAIDSVTADPVEVPVEADTGAAEASIEDFAALAEAFDPTVSVDAETAAAESALDDFASLAEASDYEGSLSLDTSEAEASLDSVAASAEEAGGSFDAASAGASGLQAASGLATGSVAGLGGAVGGLSDEMGTGVAVLTAGAGAVAAFFSEALDAESVSIRWNNTLGDMADKVEQIDVGNLNTDISSLAIQLGSSDEAMRRSALSAFQFATNSGIADEEAGHFAETILGLSARAVALNPDLGDVGDAAQTLFRGLITGREKALVPFNLGLDKTAVAARAQELALAAGRTEVTAIDKAMAGAELASGKLADAQQTIAEAAENPTIKLRSLKTQLGEYIETLGMPLIAPVFDLLEAGIPIAEAAGSVIASLARAAIPLLTAAALIAGPPLEAVANVLDAIPSPALAAVGALVLMRNVLGPLVAQVMMAGGAAGLPALARGLVTTRAAGVAAGVGMTILGSSIGGTTGQAVGMIGAGAALGAQIGGLGGAAIGAAGGGLLALGQALFGGGKSAKEMRQELSQLGTELRNVASASRAAELFLRQVLDLSEEDWGLVIVAEDFETVRRNLELLAREAPASAALVLEGIEELGPNARLTADEFAALHGVVERGAESFAKHDRAAREASAAQQLLVDTAPTASEALLEQQAALDSFVAAAVGQLPTLAGVLSTTQSNLQGFGQSLSSSASPEAFLADLNASIEGIRTFQANLQSTTALGFANVARFVAEQGPVVGGAYLQAFLAAPESVQIATDAALGEVVTATSDYDAYLRGPFAATVNAGYNAALSPLPPSTANLFGVALPASISGATPAAAAAGGSHGRAAGSAAAGGVAATAPSGFARAMQTARDAGFAGPALAGTIASAQAAGYGIGRAFGERIEAGIRSAKVGIENAAREVVRAAATAAANAGSPSVHLFYDEGFRQMEALAAGYGDAGAAAIAEAENIVRAAADVGSNGVALPYAAPGSVGASGGSIIEFNVDVSGVSDVATARAVGRAVVRGAADELDGPTRRRLMVKARTG